MLPTPDLVANPMLSASFCAVFDIVQFSFFVGEILMYGLTRVRHFPGA
jgi:hypothetical protein